MARASKTMFLHCACVVQERRACVRVCVGGDNFRRCSWNSQIKKYDAVSKWFTNLRRNRRILSAIFFMLTSRWYSRKTTWSQRPDSSWPKAATSTVVKTWKKIVVRHYIFRKGTSRKLKAYAEARKKEISQGGESKTPVYSFAMGMKGRFCDTAIHFFRILYWT